MEIKEIQLETIKLVITRFLEMSDLSSREQFITWLKSKMCIHCGDIKQVEGEVCYCLGDD